MHPMDFEEFCWALDDGVTPGFIRECFDKSKPLGALHQTVMNRYCEYLCVGGMPQAVAEYAATKDISCGDLYKAVFTGDVYFNSGMIAENAVAQSFAMSGRPLFFYSRRNPESHRNELKIDFLIRRNGYSGRIEFYRSHQHCFISALKKHLLWATA